MQTAVYLAGLVLAIAWIVLPACFLLVVVHSVVNGFRRKNERADARPSSIEPTQPANL